MSYRRSGSNPVSEQPLRVLLQFKGDDISGRIRSRHTTLTSAFYLQNMGRKYNPGRDNIHIPSTIDRSGGEKLDVNRFMCQKGVGCPDLPILCYRAEYNRDGLV